MRTLYNLSILENTLFAFWGYFFPVVTTFCSLAHLTGTWNHQCVKAGWEELSTQRWCLRSLRQKAQRSQQLIWNWCCFSLHNSSRHGTRGYRAFDNLCQKVWGVVLWPLDCPSQECPPCPDWRVHSEVKSLANLRKQHEGRRRFRIERRVEDVSRAI